MADAEELKFSLQHHARLNGCIIFGVSWHEWKICGFFIMWDIFLVSMEWEKATIRLFCFPYSFFVSPKTLWMMNYITNSQRTWSFLIFSCIIIQNVRMITFTKNFEFHCEAFMDGLDDECPWRGLLLSHTNFFYIFTGMLVQLLIENDWN